MHREPTALAADALPKLQAQLAVEVEWQSALANRPTLERMPIDRPNDQPDRAADRKSKIPKRS